MMDNFGISFVPDQAGPNGTGQGAAPADRFQQAIKILSARLPRFVGNGPAPNQLLQSPGAMGQRPTALGQTQGRMGAMGMQSMDPVHQVLMQMSGVGQTPSFDFGVLPGEHQPIPTPPSQPGLTAHPNSPMFSGGNGNILTPDQNGPGGYSGWGSPAGHPGILDWMNQRGGGPIG